MLRRVRAFSDGADREGDPEHEQLAALTLEVEEQGRRGLAKLREKGLDEPVPAIVRRRADQPAPLDPGRAAAGREVLKTMRDRAAKFNVDKVKQEDLARMGGGVPDEET